jgi:DNA-binding beta-propeller fold protein YncE
MLCLGLVAAWRAAPAIAACLLAIPGAARSQPAPLAVIAKIPLPDGKGRIDHLAFDPARRRLFVAELGNDSIAVIDVGRRRFERRLTAAAEPQGVAYLAATDTLYVASGGDGTVRAYRGADLDPVGSVDIGNDADNIRVDAEADRIYVGAGSGALVALEPRTLALLNSTPLQGHPEGFQLAARDARVFVNVPGAREIAVVDRSTRRQVASWPTGPVQENFPMAIDEESGAVLVVYREPAKIAVYDPGTGKVDRMSDVCDDADDVFVDRARGRIYVVCGAGFIDVLKSRTLEPIARIPSARGARTGLFSADEDTLFVAARATPDGSAAIWVLKPVD